MQRFTNTFSIKFYCRASRVASDGTSPIELAINLQGERFISHLPRRAKPKEFDKLMHGRKTNDLKEYLSAIELRLRNLETICYKQGDPFTLDVIKRFISMRRFVKFVNTIENANVREMLRNLWTLRWEEASNDINGRKDEENQTRQEELMNALALVA